MEPVVAPRFGARYLIIGLGALLTTTLFGCGADENDENDEKPPAGGEDEPADPVFPDDCSKPDDADWKATLEREFLDYNMAISAENREAKFAAMSESPFAFLRGSAFWYFKEMKEIGMNDEFDHSTGTGDLTAVWITGDQHMENYGAFEDFQHTVVQGTNDFDEAYVASYLLDLYRMATTIMMVARREDISHTEWKSIVIDDFVIPYVEAVESIRKDPSIAYDWKLTSETAAEPVKSYLAEVEEKRGRAAILRRWTSLNDEGIRILDRPSRMTDVTAEEYTALSALIAEPYHLVAQNSLVRSNFVVKDIKNRIRAGIGSRGVARYYALIEGETTSQDDDIILDVKFQPISAPENFIDDATKDRMTAVYGPMDQGERTAQSEVFMNLHPDPYLGYLTFNDQPFLVRQRNAYKDDLDTSDLDDPEDMRSFVSQMAKVSAFAHSRSSLPAARGPRNPITWDFPKALHDKIAGKEQKLGEHVYDVAFKLMMDTYKDYECFTELIEEGKLPGGESLVAKKLPESSEEVPTVV